MRELVRVAVRRWTVEESFQAGKGLAGLDEHQVRRWTSWRRRTLLAMRAHARQLAVICAHEHSYRPPLPDAKQYALGVLGLASLLPTQIKFEHGDILQPSS